MLACEGLMPSPPSRELIAQTSARVPCCSQTAATVAVILAVTTAKSGGDGWESNPTSLAKRLGHHH